jgi:hypothetical protein
MLFCIIQQILLCNLGQSCTFALPIGAIKLFAFKSVLDLLPAVIHGSGSHTHNGLLYLYGKVKNLLYFYGKVKN